MLGVKGVPLRRSSDHFRSGSTNMSHLAVLRIRTQRCEEYEDRSFQTVCNSKGCLFTDSLSLHLIWCGREESNFHCLAATGF